MKKNILPLLLCALLVAVSICAMDEGTGVIIGTGSDIPSLLFSQWSDTFAKNAGTNIDYIPLGPLPALVQLKAKTVDFCVTCTPLDADKLDEYGLVQFPLVGTTIVPVVNLEGIDTGGLRLSGGLLADIFAGRITMWNDERIIALNTGISIPPVPIRVVYRSDESGSTLFFSRYLSSVSPQWNNTVGYGTTVAWPVGVGVVSNEDIIDNVQRMEGSVGYLPLAYAKHSKLAIAIYDNQDEQVTNLLNESSTQTGWDITAEYDNDPGAENNWPITGVLFVQLHRKYHDISCARSMLGFFGWCYRDAHHRAQLSGYIPVPLPLVKRIETICSTIVGMDNVPVWQIPDTDRILRTNK